jgi:HAD superfamily hydrolase (TIGR01509 family)
MSIAAIQEALQHCQAVLFDLDGVIADTEPLKFAAYQQVFQETFGVELPATDVSWRGKQEQAVMQYWFEQFDLSGDIAALVQAKRSAYHQLIHSDRIPAVAGVIEFIQRLKSTPGKGSGVATSSSQQEAQTVLGTLGVLPLFDVLVTRDDVQNLKPEPDVYLKAAALLRVKPENCVVFEDSQAGVHAAKSAGAVCIGVLTSFAPTALAHADFTIANFTDLLPLNLSTCQPIK